MLWKENYFFISNNYGTAAKWCYKYGLYTVYVTFMIYHAERRSCKVVKLYRGDNKLLPWKQRSLATCASQFNWSIAHCRRIWLKKTYAMEVEQWIVVACWWRKHGYREAPPIYKFICIMPIMNLFSISCGHVFMNGWIRLISDKYRLYTEVKVVMWFIQRVLQGRCINT